MDFKKRNIFIYILYLPERQVPLGVGPGEGHLSYPRPIGEGDSVICPQTHLQVVC